MDPKQGSLKTKKSPKIAENCITEVLKPAEHELGNGKFLRCINYTSIFTKTSTLILNLEIWFIRLFDVRITEIVMKNLHPTMLSRVWTPIFFFENCNITALFLAQSICRRLNKHRLTFAYPYSCSWRLKCSDIHNFKVR